MQTDLQGKTWVFTGFSNGLGQNGVYTADLNTDTMDTVYRETSSPVCRPECRHFAPGLTVNVDGQDDSQGYPAPVGRRTDAPYDRSADPDRCDRTSLDNS